ncbi:hypothetical protein ACRAWD_21435 [Caulobacter segnis]
MENLDARHAALAGVQPGPSRLAAIEAPRARAMVAWSARASAAHADVGEVRDRPVRGPG